MRLAVILSILFVFSTGWAETYRWIDEKGTVHFTQDYGAIPEKYRDQVQEKKDDSKPGGLGSNPDKKPDQNQRDQTKGLREISRRDTLGEPGINKNKIESDASQAFEMVLTLWKDRKFEGLYDYGTEKSKVGVSKEVFVEKMRKKPWGLAPSWETVQNLEARFKNPKLVYVTGKMGFRLKNGMETKFRTETYEMLLEQGVWKTNLAKILKAP